MAAALFSEPGVDAGAVADAQAEADKAPKATPSP